mmetsp:Transcript_23615/g.32228  ORF Transcript_23615/g.32228 Transcript_23615/m.32228 type:complete len:773 (+) Transcript_23615:9-2327(+)
MFQVSRSILGFGRCLSWSNPSQILSSQARFLSALAVCQPNRIIPFHPKKQETSVLYRSTTNLNSHNFSTRFCIPPFEKFHPIKSSPITCSQLYSTRQKASKNDRESVGVPLIPVLNKLQEILQLLTTQIDLPQIVVVGGQSSGKSSVLESLVGHDFLPRGSGIVTRRPIILQLNKEEGTAEWGEFAHLPNKKFTDFHEIRNEIEKETDRVAGQSKGISKDPIILRIFSPYVIPLTLVDTPGLTRIPVGDQPKNIEVLVRDLVMTYIKPKNAIVLAVHSATQDLATSEALKIAREVDPEGSRTVGVLTKLDLMDRGTDASKVLMNELLPLRHGYVGVKNRSQEDLNQKKPMNISLKDAQKYFDQHPIYRHLSGVVGLNVLSSKCNRLLSEHIRDCLPDIRQQIQSSLDDMKMELAAYGEPITHEAEKRTFLLNTFSRFVSDFSEAVNGNVSELATDELSAGARIRFIFYEDFVKKLQAVSPTEGISLSEYRTAIRNAAGPRPALFVPDAAFSLLVKKQIEQLRAPSLECVDMVMGELVRIVTTLETEDLKRFHSLRASVVDIAISKLQSRLIPTKKMINDLIDIELAYINTNHSDFFGGTHELLKNPLPAPDSPNPTPPPEPRHQSSGFFDRIFGSSSPRETHATTNRPPIHSSVASIPPIEALALSPREQVQVKLIKMLIEQYFSITVKNLQDYVIKAVWHFLIDNSKEHLNQNLVSELYDPKLFEVLFDESPHIQDRRKHLRATIEKYEAANQVLMDVELRHLHLTHRNLF